MKEQLQIPLMAEEQRQPFEETVVRVYRCTKVVKGGRRFSFGALVVVGNRAGRVGIGYGKANEVPAAVDKAIKDAKKNMQSVVLKGRTIPHRVWGRFGSSKVILLPAGDGTGVIAGSAARAVLELAGIHDVLTKSFGSPTPKNLCKATLAGLMSLRTKEQVEEMRGVKLA
jgi:small subunit ribosomal protein S5